jgi:AcrR family transcriptional regulator
VPNNHENAPRRIGTKTSKTRAALLDAVERLMLEEGYAAVTSRRVAARAGLKPQLVYYYFRTMDDLFLATFRRRAEQGLERQAHALTSVQPLWALWDLSRDPRGTALTMEFIALANHRKPIRAEIASAAERIRAEQLEGLEAVLGRYGISAERCPPVVFTVLLSSISRFLVIERVTLGMSTGHEETVEFVEDYIFRMEGKRQPSTRDEDAGSGETPKQKVTLR